MKPELGVCYYPEHWPEEVWAEDARRMKDTGLSWVRIGEFAWSRLEAREGVFTWEWLDQAVEVLSASGLKIVMGTPSATPPKWVVEKYPGMLAVDREGRPRKFGSRRHYCFSHLGYRREAARMAASMTKRYGRDPRVQAWQIDNEYGCHDTTISYSDAACAGFREWLAQKYQTVDALNHAWGNVFWSMEYAGFDEIDLPNLTVTEANPAHWLDFRRFTSDQVVAFNRAQIDAMRPHTDCPLIHNYMGRVTDFDHFKVGGDLEIASWDSYPTGFLERNLHEDDEEWRARFACQGDPDFQAFHHDLYRAVGKGRWWVMEQQPGPVNWAPYNPIPLDGMVKLWTMEAVAHGVEVVSYFRWRQVPFAQEQMHSGLLRSDRANAQAQIEVAALAEEIAELGEIQHSDAEVALVFDYESQWAWEIQPQGKDFDYFRLVFEQYRALRKLGLNVDILPKTCRDFGNYKLVLIPGLMTWNDELKSAVEAFDGIVLAGPRTGLKTIDMQIPSSLGSDFVDATVSRVGTIRSNMSIPIADGGEIIRYYEELEARNVIEHTRDGTAVMVREGGRVYLGAWIDQAGYLRVFNTFCKETGIKTLVLEEGVRRRTIEGKVLIVNYNDREVTVEGTVIPAAGYSWQ
ncbi:MAG: beta-galactosidase [Hyphomicrobiales bacterium]|nr:beta-galactosidase [Hyphomicrobiales bacterium]MCY4052714.1 beta-galactosidase [Hyphomicrobiales bacterium]